MSHERNHGMLQIHPVKSRSDINEFICLPRKLYDRLPGYTPPLDYERRQLLHPSHGAYFKVGEVRYWTARRGKNAVGRISAQIDSFTPNGGGAGIGGFGCLDSIDDGEVVSALLASAAEWLRSRGMMRMRGPFTLSINGESGLQIEGQTQRPMILMPWHPAYLAPLVTAAGLLPVRDLLAYSALQEPPNIPVPKRLLKSIKVRGLAVRRLSHDAELMRNIFNSAWQDNWGFVPLTVADTTALCRSFRPFLHSKCGIFLERDGEVLAFGLFVPNLFDIVRDLDGRLFPFNWAHFASRAIWSKYSSVRAVLTGVRHELQNTMLGGALSILLIREAFRSWKHWPHELKEVEMGWILDNNRRMCGILEALGCVVTKRYRLYEKPLASFGTIPSSV